MSSIKWTGEPYEYTADAGDYDLRITKEGHRKWWWGCMHRPSNDSSDGYTYSYASAKARAVQAMNEHKQKQ
jgi:hypothetical protein